MTDPLDRSYRALLQAPALRQALLAMLLGRVGESMLPVALVLTALTLYESPPLAGLLTSLTVFPGLIAAPVIGALLDRFGRVRLIRLDYVVGAVMTMTITALTVTARPAEAVLVMITLLLGLTQMFSDAGTRSLFADIVPAHLWERVNAADSVGYQLAWILGPSLAAILFSIGGAPMAFGGIAVAMSLATWAIRRLREAPRATVELTGLLRSARIGIGYVLRNPTLRGLAASTSVTNVSFGIVTILVPIIVVDVIAADEGFVGLAFAAAGVMGVVAAVLFGRMNTLGRERLLIVGATAGMTASAALLLPTQGAGIAVALSWIVVSMIVFGLASGTWDIGIFTLRQRRTDPAMLGRAFAISMALNQSGYPIGAALGGWLAASSIDSAIAVAIVFGCLGTVLAVGLLPREVTVSPAGDT
ncbi:MAG: MFS transporter [Chloroflexota bacterium]